MFVTEFNSLLVSQYMYENRNLVPIIDTIKITNALFGRLDIVLNKYYNNHMEYLPLLYDFNRITDPTSINIGMFIDIPDIDSLMLTMGIYPDDENIPGVLFSMQSKELNITQQSEKSKTKTTAIPKLKITLRKVSYDATSGVITY